MLYKSLVRPVVCYGSETWVLLSKEITRLRVFERRIIRKILGGVHEEHGWRIRTNIEVDHFLGHEDIIRFIKSPRIRWLDHVMRTREREVKSILEAQMEGKRRRGRARSRWLDDVREDLQTLGVVAWRTVVQDRDKWRETVGEARLHLALQSRRKKKKEGKS